MKKITILLLPIILFNGVFCVETVSAKNRKKDKKTVVEVKKDSTSADYKKVIKDAVIKKGMFTTIYNSKEGKL